VGPENPQTVSFTRVLAGTRMFEAMRASVTVQKLDDDECAAWFEKVSAASESYSQKVDPETN
jgi:hypothetical protein